MDGRNITVEGNEIDEAILFDMAGRRMAASGKGENGNISINAGNMPQGFYNVALKNKGKITDAKKVIIK